MPRINKQELEKICRRYSIESIYAFGSRGLELKKAIAGSKEIDQSIAADFDIGVKSALKIILGVRKKSELTIALEDVFQIEKIDLVVLNETNPFLAANIIRGERIYCRNEYNADEYELYSLRRAGDLVPLERQRLKTIFNE
jgi:predicted nucleotidyltransferase